MHPSRLSYLAYNNKQIRKIVSCVRNNSGHWDLKLECGHCSSCVGHMDASIADTWGCMLCGEEYVKTSPRFAKEFE